MAFFCFHHSNKALAPALTLPTSFFTTATILAITLSIAASTLLCTFLMKPWIFSVMPDSPSSRARKPMTTGMAAASDFSIQAMAPPMAPVAMAWTELMTASTSAMICCAFSMMNITML